MQQTILLSRQAAEPRGRARASAETVSSSYKWIALSNTTLGVLIATINSSILLIALPDIVKGVGINPSAPGNTGLPLWLIMEYLVVTAVLVVSFGWLGDMFGRVRMYTAGFAVYTVFFVLLSVTCLGLVLGGLLAPLEWHLVSVLFGVFGTFWAYWKLRDTGIRRPGWLDRWGNLTFAVGLIAVMAGITYGIQPYRGHTMGWTSPWVLAALVGSVAMLPLTIGYVHTELPPATVTPATGPPVTGALVR